MQKSISNTVQWKVPFERKTGEKGIATFLEENQKCTWVGEVENIQSYVLPDSREKIKSEFDQNETIQTMTYLYSPMYQIVLVWVQTENGDYVVPYAENPELLVSKNGKYTVESENTYKLSEFMGIMNHIFDEQYLLDHPDESTGLAYRNEKNMLQVVVIIGGVLVLGMAYLITKKSKQKSYYHT